MPLRIERYGPNPNVSARGQLESYTVHSGRLLVAGIIEIKEWHLVDRKWIDKRTGWGWGMDVAISARAAPRDLPQGGKAASLEEAIEKIDDTWNHWVQYLGLARTGT